MGARGTFSALQHSDSLFPSGMTAFSWGLEQLWEEGRIAGPRELGAFLRDQLLWRWESFDRAFLVEAHAAHADPAELVRLDRLCGVSIAAKELREGSARAGRALLAVHAKLGTPGAGDYRITIGADPLLGQLPVVQGLTWGALGFTADMASMLSAYGCAAAHVAAAIRLGAIGHLDGQRTLSEVAALVERIVGEPAPTTADAASFAPVADIAAMRHEAAERRLFAN